MKNVRTGEAMGEDVHGGEKGECTVIVVTQEDAT